MQPFEREIVELHQFFEDWFNGRCDEAGFGRLERALAPGMTFITTAGKLIPRNDLLDAVRDSYGKRPGLTIITRGHVLRFRTGGILLATYREVQEEAGGTTERLTSVILRETEESGNGLEWVHVHETWIGQGRKEYDGITKKKQ